MPSTSARFSITCLAALLGVFCPLRPVSAAEPADAPRVAWDALRDVWGEPITVADAPWRVVSFLGTECPLARLYGPRLQKLEQQFADQGVRIVGIISNPQDSPDDIRQFAEEHGLQFPLIKDRDQQLARRFGATRTPEVFVLDAANRVRYQGRIDDQYDPGISRAEARRNHLRLALEALISGREVPTARTEAVGCLITFIDRPRASGDVPTELPANVTFTRDVAPILHQHCVECHRAGEIGPFALTDYEEVVGWGEMIVEVVQQGRMPPWHADPRHGRFVGERRLPAEARRTLEAWVAGGMRQGDPRHLPEPPAWPAGWHLKSPPDVEIAMREPPFPVPAEGTVEYQYFVVDPGWEEDRWVRAAQVIPGNASVVHHAIVFVRPPDGSRHGGIGWLGGYVPGQRTAPLPDGHARLIPARSKLVFQMHYTPNGRPAEDITKVGVWFSDAAQVTHEVKTRVALNHHFEIPPGAKDHVVQLRLDKFDRQARLLGAMPHMHLRGRSFRLDARRGERAETLLLVPRYDFNWQHWYQFQQPLELDRVDALEMEVRFDNSAQNPTNPDPEEYVTWGDQTWQEMAVAFFDIAYPRAKPVEDTGRVVTVNPPDAAHRRRVEQEADRFLAQLDKNRDGIVTREETPDAFRRFGFREMDQNGDGRLDRGEIEAAAARRL